MFHSSSRVPVMRARWLAGLAALTLTAGCLGDDFQAAQPTAPSTSSNDVAQTRTYFIAADDVVWDYAPSGINQITGQPFDEAANVFVANGPDRIGKKYIKALYREYTDGTFRHRKAMPAHLGTLGPVIRAVVGDTIVV